MNDIGSGRMASWGELHARLAKADEERRLWLERQGARLKTCDACGAQLQAHNLSGYCQECRRLGPRRRGGSDGS